MDVSPSSPERKRKKVSFADPTTESEEIAEIHHLDPHPLGVQPMGNIYWDDQGPANFAALRRGLGHLAYFSDEEMLTLLSYLSAETLSILGAVSRAFYVFTREDSLWRHQVLDRYGGNFQFYRNWRFTYAYQQVKEKNIQSFELLPPLQVSGFYSDYLYQIWRCATCDLEQWSSVDNVDRRSNLTLEEFIEEYEKPGKPVILTDIVPSWLAYSSDSGRQWDKENLLKRFGHIVFKAGAVEMTLADYWNYIRQTREESPIYLFDNEFSEKAPPMHEEYGVAPYFSTDYFSLLDDQPHRPSYKWILIGPPRSGSTFHKDPNYTSAWNGVISGRKKWILFPPDQTPPGVIPSEDELDVTTPISVSEWFLNFYPTARKSKPYECVQKSGELLFIPHRWWHCALNLEECVAVTQNYVNNQNLVYVMDFLIKCNKQRIIQPLERKLEETQPGLLDRVREEKDKKTSSQPTSAWDKLTADTGESFSFSFNFQ